jgi:hypothetical protein
MHSSFIEEGVSERDIKALGTLENLSRAEKIDFNVLGATVRLSLLSLSVTEHTADTWYI